MGRAEVAFFFVMAVAAPGLVPGPAAGQAGDVRGSILVVGDDDFIPENGVRSGAGTAQDPYVISDWEIVQNDAFGIRLVGTNSHVVVEQVLIRGDAGPVVAVQDCFRGEPFCADLGIDLQYANNVTIREVAVTGESLGLFVRYSSNLVVEDTQLGDPRLPWWLHSSMGASVRGSHNVTFRNVGFVANVSPAAVWGNSDRVTIENSRFYSPEQSLVLENARDVRIERSDFRATDILLAQGVSRLRITDNSFRGENWALQNHVWPSRVESVLFCGNDVLTGAEHSASVDLADVHGFLAVGNRFEENREGMWISRSRGVVLEANEVRGSEGAGLRMGARDALLRNNSFVGNGGGIVFSSRADARYNWWGSPDGPSGAGSGSGDALADPLQSVVFEPWLVQEPRAAVECSALEPPTPPPADPPLSVIARAASARGPAYVAHLNATGDDKIVITSYFNFSGRDDALLAFWYDPARPDEADYFGYVSRGGILRVVGSSPGLGELDFTPPPFEPVTFPARVRFRCEAPSCPPAFALMFATSHGLSGTVTEVAATRQASLDDLVVTDNSALLSFYTMDSEGTRLRSESVATVSVARGVREPIPVSNRLLGWSTYVGLDNGLVNYTMEGPDGTVRNADQRTYLWEEPGEYVMRLEQTSAGEWESPYFLFADLPL